VSPLHEDSTFPIEVPMPRLSHASHEVPVHVQDFVIKSGGETASEPSPPHEPSPTQEGPEMAGLPGLLYATELHA